MQIQGLLDTEFAKVSNESQSCQPFNNLLPSNELGIPSLQNEKSEPINLSTENLTSVIDLSSIIDNTVASQMSDSKWQNRKEALDLVTREVSKAKKPIKISNCKFNFIIDILKSMFM